MTQTKYAYAKICICKYAKLFKDEPKDHKKNTLSFVWHTFMATASFGEPLSNYKVYMQKLTFSIR